MLKAVNRLIAYFLSSNLRKVSLNENAKMLVRSF
ncbi:unnamed protein product [Brugia timori]|uniref:Uncharacterized protein n=1 Tax=Brugia timori TaxID=42155 RepID=A0A0R3Q7V8_9BILA|nr:unnamed protein product [Brugia timori]